MRKTLAAVLFSILTTTGFAQETAANSNDILNQKVESLTAKVTTLQSRLSIGGFALAALTFNTNDGTVLATDGYTNTLNKAYNANFFRLNTVYSDPYASFNARLDIQPFVVDKNLAGTVQSTADKSNNSFVTVKFAEGSLWAVPKYLKVGFGIVDNEKDFALCFASAGVAGPGLFNGLDVLNATQTAYLLSATPSGGKAIIGPSQTAGTFADPQGGFYGGNVGAEALFYFPTKDFLGFDYGTLELGWFLPAGVYTAIPGNPINGKAVNADTSTAQTTNSRVLAVVTDARSQVFQAADYNLAYAYAPLGKIRFGYQGFKAKANSDNTYTNAFFNNDLYANVEFRPQVLPEFYAGVGYEAKAGTDNGLKYHNWYLTGSWDFRSAGLKDLFVSEDFAVSVDVNSNPLYVTDSQVKYTFKGLIGGNDLVPILRVKYLTYTNANASTSEQTPDYWTLGFEPKVQIVTPNGSLFAVGLGSYTGGANTASTTYNFISAGTVIVY